MYLAAFLFGEDMINFENLDKFTFPGVGKYGIPEIEPTNEYPVGEFIPMNEHLPEVGIDLAGENSFLCRSVAILSEILYNKLINI